MIDLLVWRRAHVPGKGGTPLLYSLVLLLLYLPRYKAMQYVSVALITAGVAVFMVKPGSKGSKGATPRPPSPPRATRHHAQTGARTV